MKKAAALFVGSLGSVVLAGSLAGQMNGGLVIKPQFEPDVLIVRLTERLDAPVTGPDPDELFAAAGVHVVSELPSTTPGSTFVTVRLDPGSSFGRSFQIMQAFDFGDDATWSLDLIQPNFIFCGIPEGCPGVIEARQVFGLSARAEVGRGEGATIGGLIVPGSYPRLVVIKVRGPSLESFGVNAVLDDPVLQLFSGNSPILQNDNWGDLSEWELTTAASVCPPPADPAESMLVTYLDPGAYTAIVRGTDDGVGVALLEFYVVDAFRTEIAVQ